MIWNNKDNISKDESVAIRNSIKELSFTIELQNKKISELFQDYEKVKKTYANWIEESKTTIDQLRQRIEKKIDYVNRNQNQKIDLRALARERILRKAGVIPKTLNTNANIVEEVLESQDET